MNNLLTSGGEKCLFFVDLVGESVRIWVVVGRNVAKSAVVESVVDNFFEL